MADLTPAERSHIRPVPPASLPDRDRFLSPLPTPLTSFVGREHEVRAAAALLRRPGVRLVTLTGPGGVGKTRLALRVAEEAAPDVADGASFVSLAPVTDAALVASTVAQALGVRETGNHPAAERLAEALRDRRVLLVLDNLEQVVEAVPLIPALLVACPGLRILATSRVPLRVSGEHVFSIAPLRLPSPSDSPAHLAENEAVRLFVDRACAADPAFTLTEDNAIAVAAICRRLDGLPLAIELAAAKVRLLPPPVLLPRLARALPLLVGGNRDDPSRLRTMRDAIAWSHDLLSPAERVLFQRLAVFVGGFTLEAAATVIGASEADVLAGVEALAEQSLVHRLAGTAEEPRFGMLETVREFGLARLADTGDEATVRNAHANWYRDRAAQAAPRWFTPAQDRWGDQFEAEHGNLRAALAWLADTDIQACLTLIVALWPFWFVRGHGAEGRGWLARAITWSSGTRTAERAWVLIGAGAVAVDRSGEEPAAWGNEALEIARELGDGVAEASALVACGAAEKARGEAERAREMTEAALAAWRALSNTVAHAEPNVSLMLGNLAEMALGQGDVERARLLAEEGLALQRRLGFAWGAANSLLILARVARGDGDAVREVALVREGLSLARDGHDPQQTVAALDQLARLAAESGAAARAARLFGAAERLHDQLDGPPAPGQNAERDAVVTAVRTTLGESDFATAWAAGRALLLEEAVEEALEDPFPPAEPVVPAVADTLLTPREHQVLRHLAQGLTDRQIADELSIGRRTVEWHRTNLFNKLGVGSRAALAADAVRRGLV